MTAVAGGLLLVGGGKMGGAMLSGWLERGGVGGPIAVVEPAEAARASLAALAGVLAVPDLDQLPAGFAPDTVVFAVKPQGMERIVPAYARFAAPGRVFLSIAAGRAIAFLAAHLSAEAAIVRAMPNTPAAVGRGISVCCANPRVSAAQRERCTALLTAVGDVAWVEDEGLMDAVTAVSGSGPAYVFLLAECLAQAGAEVGLPAGLAARLARATVAGAGELLHRAAESPATLRENVTSPAGTTAAALAVLMAADGLAPLLTRAVAAATRRSRELAG